MNKLLERLHRVRKTGPNQYTALCPAHADDSPSLAVKILEDGRTLIHCHAGCGGSDIMNAVGLSLADLYPEGSLGDFRPNWYMRKAKQESDHERLVLSLAAADRANGKRLSPEDLKRERQAWLALNRKNTHES